MPLYDFKCRECGAVRELIAPSNQKVADCSNCGSGVGCDRLMPTGALAIYKVRGFYTTDYTNRNSNPGKSKR